MSLADVYFRAGDTKNAILKFEQAQMLDPYLIKGVELPSGWRCSRHRRRHRHHQVCPDGRVLCRSVSAGMDVYGYLMAREGHLEDVEVLGGRLFNISDQHAEPWVISG